jgi:hypothetical protein
MLIAAVESPGRILLKQGFVPDLTSKDLTSILSIVKPLGEAYKGLNDD